MPYLISINKPHTDNIFSDKKTIEWRKKKLPDGFYYVYETKNKGGCGAVVGIIFINNAMKDKPYIVSTYESIHWLPDDYIKEGCVDRLFLEEYIGEDSGNLLWGNRIERTLKFKEPIPINLFTSAELKQVTKPPQFYMRCQILSWSILCKVLE